MVMGNGFSPGSLGGDISHLAVSFTGVVVCLLVKSRGECVRLKIWEIVTMTSSERYQGCAG
jgi:hypothetical protein